MTNAKRERSLALLQKMSGKNAIQTPRRQLWLNARMMTKTAKRERSLVLSPKKSGRNAILLHRRKRMPKQMVKELSWRRIQKVLSPIQSAHLQDGVVRNGNMPRRKEIRSFSIQSISHLIKISRTHRLTLRTRRLTKALGICLRIHLHMAKLFPKSKKSCKRK